MNLVDFAIHAMIGSALPTKENAPLLLSAVSGGCIPRKEKAIVDNNDSITTSPNGTPPNQELTVSRPITAFVAIETTEAYGTVSKNLLPHLYLSVEDAETSIERLKDYEGADWVEWVRRGGVEWVSRNYFERSRDNWVTLEIYCVRENGGAK